MKSLLASIQYVYTLQRTDSTSQERTPPLAIESCRHGEPNLKAPSMPV